MRKVVNSTVQEAVVSAFASASSSPGIRHVSPCQHVSEASVEAPESGSADDLGNRGSRISLEAAFDSEEVIQSRSLKERYIIKPPKIPPRSVMLVENQVGNAAVNSVDMIISLW